MMARMIGNTVESFLKFTKFSQFFFFMRGYANEEKNYQSTNRESTGGRY